LPPPTPAPAPTTSTTATSGTSSGWYTGGGYISGGCSTTGMALQMLPVDQCMLAYRGLPERRTTLAYAGPGTCAVPPRACWLSYEVQVLRGDGSLETLSFSLYVTDLYLLDLEGMGIPLGADLSDLPPLGTSLGNGWEFTAAKSSTGAVRPSSTTTKRTPDCP
jgi:hypothetical protein